MVRATQQWRRHSFFRKSALGDAVKQLGLPEGAQVTCAHLVELKPRRDEDAITMSDVDEATTKQLKEPSIKALVVVGDDGGRIVVCDGHLSNDKIHFGGFAVDGQFGEITVEPGAVWVSRRSTASRASPTQPSRCPSRRARRRRSTC